MFYLDLFEKGLASSFLLSTLPNPDPLIELCEAIIIARNECDFYKYFIQKVEIILREELLYYYLIDVLRSPEVVKALTGSCVEAIREKEKKLKIN